MTAAAVVVAWRSGDRAAAALDDLRAVAPDLRPVLVDNEADPATLARLAADRPDVDVVALPDNRGYAGGANAGLDRAFADGHDHAVLLNDDVRLEPGCAEALVAAAGADGCAAPIVDGPGTAAFAGAAIDWRRGFGRHEPGADDYLNGAVLCVPRAVWERVGPFDERLFLYYEDVDWSFRARELGVPLRVVSEARARHAAGTTTGGAEGPTWAYYATRNRLWFLERHRGRAAARREAAHTAARSAARALAGGSRAVARAKLEGVRDWHRGRMGRGPYPR